MLAKGFDIPPASQCVRPEPRRAGPTEMLAQGFGMQRIDPPSPPPPPKKEKAKTDRFLLEFTCNVCDTRNSHSISRHAYGKGTVIATCPGCKTGHLIADNLNWIVDDFKNLKEAMAKRGVPVTDLRVETSRAATDAAAAAVAAMPAPEAPVAASATPLPDGVSEDMALRIRAAVRANKQRRALEEAEAAARAREDGGGTEAP